MQLRKLCGPVLFIASLSATSGIAQVYLWQDEDGRAQITKEPPADWKPEPPRPAKPLALPENSAQKMGRETKRHRIAGNDGRDVRHDVVPALRESARLLSLTGLQRTAYGQTC
jgi:hypothetical protein